MVRIYVTKNNIQLDVDTLTHIISTLPLSMQNRANSIVPWQSRQAYIFGRLIVLEMLQEFSIDDDLSGMNYSNYDRPYFNGKIDFNISHSNDFVVCIASDECKVGIDIEKIKTLDVGSFREEFNILEWQSISEGVTRHDYNYFYQLWTQKEATLKAHGTGLSIPLKDVILREDHSLINKQVWYLYPIQISEDYATNIAVSKIISIPITKELLFL